MIITIMIIKMKILLMILVISITMTIIMTIHLRWYVHKVWYISNELRLFKYIQTKGTKNIQNTDQDNARVR